VTGTKTLSNKAFATDVLDATEGDLYAVKELLGHSSTRVTEVYLHSSRTRTESAVRTLFEGAETVKPKRAKTRMSKRLKAPSGLEPLYEALQASA
jgi:integrase